MVQVIESSVTVRVFQVRQIISTKDPEPTEFSTLTIRSNNQLKE